MKKGQLTVEYLIILVTMILLFSSISMDLMQYSLSESTKIQTGEMLKSANNTILNAVNQVKIQGPGAKKTVMLRAPSDCNYTVGVANMVILCIPGTPSYEVYDNTGFAIVPPLSGVMLNCVTCTGSVIESGNLEKIEVVKQ